jgi:hypothetical protein
MSLSVLNRFGVTPVVSQLHLGQLVKQSQLQNEEACRTSKEGFYGTCNLQKEPIFLPLKSLILFSAVHQL